VALTIAIVVATLGGYALGFFAGHAYWSRLGTRVGVEMARSEPKAAHSDAEQQAVVDLEVKLLRTQSELVRLEFKCAELTAQLQAQNREHDRWTSKPS
jgi:hypothetical protein